MSDDKAAAKVEEPVPGTPPRAGSDSEPDDPEFVDGVATSDPCSVYLRRPTKGELRRRNELETKRKSDGPAYYGEYLQLDKILNAQKMYSTYVHPAGSHDEHLFIIIHQVYELWFKQILFELGSVIQIFNRDSVPETLVSVAVARLERVTEIQRILLDQIKVLETMTPGDFLDFRGYLFPSSGFQSKQFRLVENRLGLKEDQRLVFGNARYCSYLAPKDAVEVEAAQDTEPTLFSVIESWLERTPFVRVGEFDVWQKYQEAVEEMLDGNAKAAQHSRFTEETRDELLKSIEVNRAHFKTMVHKASYEKLRESGQWRLSHKAMIAALMINLYKDEAVFTTPYRLLHLLLDVDEFLTSWRYRHALMVQRMLGVKIGTGGSSGYHYLRATAQHHKIFNDFANLATFLIPRSHLPPLPHDVRAMLGFAADLESNSAKLSPKKPVAPPTPPSTSGSGEGAGAGEAPKKCPFGHGSQ